MRLNEYQKQALATMAEYSSKKDQIINGLLGLAGESGEVCDLLKKHFLIKNEPRGMDQNLAEPETEQETASKDFNNFRLF